ncbi:hypothetical protein [Paenibacillus sp. FSL P4-0288]|uniref:hypothetical protein n=1 Tax=Paenibacillus sp. FSL P4-0288 TaxID=2921633 RepID=UPI0030F5CC71
MNKYTGSIEIPKASLTPILIAALVNHVNFEGMGVKFDEYSFQPGLEDPDIVVFTEDGAENGQFDEMEEFFVQHQIPFNRFSDSFCEIQPEYRKYRPSKHGIELVDVTVIEDHANNSYVLCSDLRDALQLEPEAALQKIGTLLEESDPAIIALSFYRGINALVIEEEIGE